MKKLAFMLIIISLLTFSIAAMADTKTAQVPKPSAVTITGEAFNSGCTISWKRIEEDNINYYNVYYMKVADDNRTYKASEILEKGTVKRKDTALFTMMPTTAGQEGKYAFVVTAINYPGEESKPSNVVIVEAKQNMHFSY